MFSEYQPDVSLATEFREWEIGQKLSSIDMGVGKMYGV